MARMKGLKASELSKAQFVRIAVALCMGTVCEWYDFSIYSQLSPIITELFFPSADATVAQLSFWGVYAVGFLSRPLGAILFGHIGDTLGRRMTMLLSVLLVTLPTLLIGCLPTYAMIGLAAPVLMALLRAVQGCAVGGEFGGAITYLYELAPKGRKGIMGSLGQMAVAPGMILGILMCQAVLYGTSPEQLRLWGWRVPFLLTVFAAPFAVVMRMDMPEPTEFVQDKKQMVAMRITKTASVNVAKAYSKQHPSLVPSGSLKHRAHGGVPTVASLEAGTAGGAAAPHPLTVKQLSLKLQESVCVQEDGSLVTTGSCHTPGMAGAGHGGQHQHQHLGALTSFKDAEAQDPHNMMGSPFAEPVPEECAVQFEQEVQALSGKIKHHVPLAVLFRQHWPGLLLQWMLEACFGNSFYTFFSWAPSYAAKTLHIPMSYALWALLFGLVLSIATIILTGHFINDSKARKVFAVMAVATVTAAIIIPTMLCFEHHPKATMWTLVPLMLSLAGMQGALITTIAPTIFPPAVRLSGYNLGHNLAMSTFGGLTPLVVTALATVLHPTSLAAGVLIVITTGITLAAGAALIYVIPATNAPCPAGQHDQWMQEQEMKKRVAADGARHGNKDTAAHA